MNEKLLEELLELSPAERIDLAEKLWDSIGPEDMPPLTPEQQQEIDRRMAEHQKDPSTAIPWEDVRDWLWSRRG
jgi:putative addiction module component (TIGR02574 family)